MSSLAKIKINTIGFGYLTDVIRSDSFLVPTLDITFILGRGHLTKLKAIQKIKQVFR